MIQPSVGACWPDDPFDNWAPHGKNREPIPAHFSLTSANMLYHIGAHTHMDIHAHNRS